MLILSASASTAELDEYRAKSVFLYKFATFVEWPADTLKPGTEPVTICVLGQSALEQTLSATVKDKQIDGRGFVVRPVADAKQASGCHLLFVTGAGMKRFRTARNDWKALTGVLVVGESDGFASEGGVINFKLSDGRLRLEVNLAEARRGRLVINSRLLGMADVVER